MNPKTSLPKSSLSVALLFQVVTLAGIVAASLANVPWRSESINSNVIMLTMIYGAVLGCIIGILPTIFYARDFVSLSCVSLTAGSLGAMVGLLLLIPNDHFFRVILISFSGSWLILITMLLVARWSERESATTSNFSDAD